MQLNNTESYFPDPNYSAYKAHTSLFSISWRHDMKKGNLRGAAYFIFLVDLFSRRNQCLKDTYAWVGRDYMKATSLVSEATYGMA